MEWIYWLIIALWLVVWASLGVAIVFRRQLDQIAPDFRKET
jgi:hypothetical protein